MAQRRWYGKRKNWKNNKRPYKAQVKRPWRKKVYSNKRAIKPRTRRPIPPLVTRPAQEYLGPKSISPYAPLGGRMPEYLPDHVPPWAYQNPNPLLRPKVLWDGPDHY
ncbi:MAG: hypothetical protein HW389_773 [Bacteroidetes bacterium]|nr:hypothetical protein [Bacteroidota bacterium]